MSVLADRLDLRPERSSRAPAAPPLHVLHVFESGSDAVARYVTSAVDGLSASGWRVSVACPDGAAPHGLKALPIRIGPWGVQKLARWCRELGVSVIHAHQAKPGLVAALAGRRASIPSIYTPHGWGFDRPGSRASRLACALLERQLAHRYHARVLALCNADRISAERWRVAPRGRIQVVPLGPSGSSPVSRAAARRELAIDGGAFVAAWVGPDGDGARLATHLRDHGVIVVPAGGAPATAYAAADVMLHTAACDGCPVEVLDAMAARLPIVAYDIGGLREQVQVGRTGHLVAPGDVEMLCECVLALARRPDLRLKMGEASHARVADRFSRSAMVARLTETYTAVAGRPPENGWVGQPDPALIISSCL